MSDSDDLSGPVAAAAGAREPGRPFTVRTVAVAAGCPVERARESLAALVEQGALRSRRVDGRRVWWRPPPARDDGANPGAGGPNPEAGLLRRIVETIATADDRATLETAVCEAAVSTGRFVGAAAIEEGREGGEPVLRTSAATSVAVDDLLSAAEYDPERVTVGGTSGAQAGCDAVATVPVSQRTADYGYLVLGVDDGAAALDRESLRAVGEALGLAIGTVQRRRLFIDEQVVELELVSAAVAEPFREACDDLGRIRLDGAVPVGDGTSLLFFAAEGVDGAGVREAFGSFPQVSRVRVHDGGGEELRFELRTSERTLVELLAARGGRLREMIIEEEGALLVAELPRATDVRSAIEDARSVYPDLRLRSKRTVECRTDSVDETREAVLDRLTDRQRAVLEAAFHAGYFEWPRATTGEAAAEGLDVSPPTFHEHLRAGERKLLAALFGS